MPRYHFNLTNDEEVEDAEGEFCETLEHAKKVAIRTARELGRNRSSEDISHLNVCVTDENGREVFSTPVTNT